jgi:hypothetical protein
MIKCRINFNIIFILLFYIIDVISVEINYQIFQPKLQNNSTLENNEFNSIYGTGNRLKDVVYKTACLSTCNSLHIDVQNSCCSGNDINKLECKSEQFCKLLKKYIDDYLFSIIISSYSAFIIITMITMFIIFYYLSYTKFLAQEIKLSGEYTKISNINKKQSLINGLVAATLTLFLFLIFPILILKTISIFKKKSMTSLLGGKFQIISSFKLLTSIEIKESEKEKRFSNLNEEKTWSQRNCKSNYDYNEKNYKIGFSENISNNQKNIIVENIDLEIVSNQNTEQIIDTSKKLKIFNDNK